MLAVVSGYPMYIYYCKIYREFSTPTIQFLLILKTYSPRDASFAGSNPAEVDGFFQDVKIMSTSPPGGTLSWGSRV